jgi:DNA-binding MarR family transcriptional regulator/predicted GNAT family acetyltransferase
MNHWDPLNAAVAVRRFNHFYARYASGLQERLRQSALSGAEVRVLSALTHEPLQTAAQVARSLELDTGYLSRILSRFEHIGYVIRQPKIDDARKHLLILTASGREAFEELDEGGIGEMSAVLRHFADCERAQLMSSMADIERLLSPSCDLERVRVRAPRHGDFGWIVEHCALLAADDHAGSPMEAHAAAIVARFLDPSQDARRAACWIAEQHHGSRIGAALLMPAPDRLARIELLFVEPGARRRGLGSRLIDACSQSAFNAGYEHLSCSFDERHADLREFVLSNGFASTDSGWRRSLSAVDA